MSIIKFSDFYYGAVLSMLLFNKKFKPALVESDDNRQVYDLSNDKADYRIFIKYRSKKQDIKTIDYNSWSFSFTDVDKSEIQDYLDDGYNLFLILVCATTELSGSEIAVVNKQEIKELFSLGKDSITISRKKGEHSFRISIGGGRENAMLIRNNRFEELF